MLKLKIHPYNQKFLRKFGREKKRILKVIKDCEIHHIGSTAVPGLGGKGIIDIMIGIKSWRVAKEIIKKFKELGFTHLHPKEKGRIFLSKNRTLSLNNVHIHIVKTGSKAYKDLLFFRDYLRKNKKEVSKFFKLKLEWIKEARGDREKYEKLKGKYVKEILDKFNN